MLMAPIKFTAADYRALPEDAPRMELLDGEFVLMPAPSVPHQAACRNVIIALGNHFAATGNGTVLGSPCDVYLGEAHVLQPDVLAVLAEHQEVLHEDCVHGPPDLVVEILSRDSGARDWTLKREIYRRAGVAEYWIIDPVARTVTVLRLQEAGARRSGHDGEVVDSPLLPDLRLGVTEVFAP